MDTSTVSMGQVLDNKTVTETPLIAGNATVTASYSPGVLFMPTYPKDVRPFDTGSGSAIAGDGTLLGNAQFLLDGAANNELVDKGFSYEPPQGAIQEVKVQTASFDASYGYWSGVTLNVSLKSGTNTLHGQAYYFNQNPAVDADQFFANQFGSAKYEYKAHRWGGVLTGPVYLPKLYDGRNKTFFMYGYEGMWTFDPVSIGFESEPTPAQRTGNFSDLLALGAKYQIYDPYSTVPAPGGLFTRTPVPNNIIPASQINPVGAAIINLFDLPNRTGTADGTNNYTNGRNSHDTFYNHIIRIDHNLSDKQRFFVRFDVTQNERKQDQRHHDALGHLMYRRNQPGAAIDHVYTISPQFFINTRYSYTRYINPTTPDQLGWNLAGMGFSPTFINQITAMGPDYLRLPQIVAKQWAGNWSGRLFRALHSDRYFQSRHDARLCNERDQDLRHAYATIWGRLSGLREQRGFAGEFVRSFQFRQHLVERSGEHFRSGAGRAGHGQSTIWTANQRQPFYLRFQFRRVGQNLLHLSPGRLEIELGSSP